MSGVAGNPPGEPAGVVADTRVVSVQRPRASGEPRPRHPTQPFHSASISATVAASCRPAPASSACSEHVPGSPQLSLELADSRPQRGDRRARLAFPPLRPISAGSTRREWNAHSPSDGRARQPHGSPRWFLAEHRGPRGFALNHAARDRHGTPRETAQPTRPARQQPLKPLTRAFSPRPRPWSHSRYGESRRDLAPPSTTTLTPGISVNAACERKSTPPR